MPITHSNRASAGGMSLQAGSRPRILRSLLGRFLILAALLGLDILLIASIPHSSSLLKVAAPIGIVSYAVFVGLGYSHFKRQKEDLQFGVWLYLIHLVCVLSVCLISLAALHGYEVPLLLPWTNLLLRLVLLAGVALLALACIPLAVWIRTVRETRLLWLYSTLAGTLAWCLRFPFQSFWDSASTAPGRVLQILTFHSVKALLRVFIPDVLVDPVTFTIGTPRFAIIVAEACSGLEGLGLVLVFTTIWLWYFRKESRFPQALLLVPCALGCVWMLNIVRIAALVLIGNAGFGEVAMVGFHSQAGWIAFTTVAFGFSMVTRKMRWVRRHYYYPAVTGDGGPVGPVFVDDSDDEAGESPATAAYLVPFLAILAASFLSKAASGYFEWLYPLRFFAAAIAIWYYRRELKQFDWSLDWRRGWLGPVVGAVVFAVWLAPTWWSHSSGASQMGESLAALSPVARWSWIAIRVLAAVVTVPIAEELAFRGYLVRRLVDREFDAVPFSGVTLISVGLSSVVFGLMHGRQWIVGILAGLAYAGVMKWRGRLSDAIVAHATTNLLLAVWVLSRGDWSQW